jgi:hypothetical protein
MYSQAISSSLGYLIAWFLILPIFVIGGGATLILYAVLAEIGAILTGSSGNTLDPAEARELARRICLGHGEVAAG